MGDSRAYLISDGKIEQLTEDHSLRVQLVKQGKVSEEVASQTIGRNVLARALGKESDVEVDLTSGDLGPGERLLLCSDGLWDMITDAEIAEIVNRSQTSGEAVIKLVKKAKEAGGLDNIGVVVLKREW